MKMWRRSGTTGSSTPAIAATWPAHGPAALTTARVAIGPADVVTPAMRPWTTSMPVRSVPRSTVTRPRRCAAFTKPMVTPFGSAMPSAAQKVAARTPAASSPGVIAAASPADSHCTSRPSWRWSATLLAERRFAGLARQQEQVAVLPEVDRAADLGFEAREERDRLARQRDVGADRRTGGARRRRCARWSRCRAGPRARPARSRRRRGRPGSRRWPRPCSRRRRSPRPPCASAASYHPGWRYAEAAVTPAGVRPGGGPCARP